MDNSGVTWKRPAIEASVIIFSILFAFAIDAWWGAVDAILQLLSTELGSGD